MGCMGNPHLPDFCIFGDVPYDPAGMEASKEENFRMNWQGWVFMLTVWGFVGSLFVYSFYRILFGDQIRQKREKNFERSRRL